MVFWVRYWDVGERGVWREHGERIKHYLYTMYTCMHRYSPAVKLKLYRAGLTEPPQTFIATENAFDLVSGINLHLFKFVRRKFMEIPSVMLGKLEGPHSSPSLESWFIYGKSSPFITHIIWG